MKAKNPHCVFFFSKFDIKRLDFANYEVIMFRNGEFIIPRFRKKWRETKNACYEGQNICIVDLVLHSIQQINYFPNCPL